MNKIILTTLTAIILITKISAQDPDFAMDYQQNRSLINPAYLAKNNFITANILYNRAWIYPGAPSHSTLWMSGKFSEHMGAAIQVSSKSLGLFRKTMLSGTYAFDVTLNKRTYTHLSFGISGGLLQDFYNASRMQTIFSDPFLSQTKLNRFYPQIATGIMLYNDFFQIGISAMRLLPFSGYFLSNLPEILSPALIIHGAYYYKDPLDLYRFSPDFIISFSKEKIYLETNISSFTRSKKFKYGVGLSSAYITQYKIIRINISAFAGFRISERLFIIYKFDLNALNAHTPFITKLGNSLGIRLDFYQHQYDIPEFF